MTTTLTDATPMPREFYLAVIVPLRRSRKHRLRQAARALLDAWRLGLLADQPGTTDQDWRYYSRYATLLACFTSSFNAEFDAGQLLDEDQAARVTLRLVEDSVRTTMARLEMDLGELVTAQLGRETAGGRDH